jgi:hypothetical protein
MTTALALLETILHHRLTDIARHHVDKVRVRLLPTKREYESLFGRPPRRITEALQPR